MFEPPSLGGENPSGHGAMVNGTFKESCRPDGVWSELTENLSIPSVEGIPEIAIVRFGWLVEKAKASALFV